MHFNKIVLNRTWTNLDDELRAFAVGLAGRDKVKLVSALPLHEELKLAVDIGRSDDLLSLKCASDF